MDPNLFGELDFARVFGRHVDMLHSFFGPPKKPIKNEALKLISPSNIGEIMK